MTQAFLKTNFDYRNDGVLIRKIDVNVRFKKGDVITGAPNTHGHRRLWIGGKLTYLHRAIFCWHRGWLPKVIDHIDGDPSNNRIENLRAVEHCANLWNTKISAANTLGSKGLLFDRQTGRWSGQVKSRGKVYQVGASLDRDHVIQKLIELRASVQKIVEVQK